MYELSYSLYGSEKRVLEVCPTYKEAFGEMYKMYKIVRNAQCSDFYIKNLENGSISIFNYDDLVSAID